MMAINISPKCTMKRKVETIVYPAHRYASKRESGNQTKVRDTHYVTTCIV